MEGATYDIKKSGLEPSGMVNQSIIFYCLFRDFQDYYLHGGFIGGCLCYPLFLFVLLIQEPFLTHKLKEFHKYLESKVVYKSSNLMKLCKILLLLGQYFCF